MPFGDKPSVVEVGRGPRDEGKEEGRLGENSYSRAHLFLQSRAEHTFLGRESISEISLEKSGINELDN